MTANRQKRCEMASVITTHQSFFNRLDLQSQKPGVIPREGQIACYKPEARMSGSAPDRLQLPLFIKTPDVFELTCDALSKDIFGGILHGSVSGSENDLVGWEVRPIGQYHAVGSDLGHLLALLDLDVSADDEFRGADVNVITPTFFQEFQFSPGVIG